jgi:hypothetical protein
MGVTTIRILPGDDFDGPAAFCDRLLFSEAGRSPAEQLIIEHPTRHGARGMLFTWCVSTVRNRLILLVGAFALVGALVAPVAGAGIAAKALNPCSALTPEDLEPIFEQPFRKGLQDDGGNCLFRKPQLLKKDDIVVSVMPERFGSVKRAKKAFAEVKRVTTELAGQVEDVTSGNQAFYALLIGTDLLTMRVGRVVVSARVENNDDDEATYHDQVIAVGQAIAVRLATAA